MAANTSMCRLTPMCKAHCDFGLLSENNSHAQTKISACYSLTQYVTGCDKNTSTLSLRNEGSSALAKRDGWPDVVTTLSTNVVLPTCRGPATTCKKRRGSARRCASMLACGLINGGEEWLMTNYSMRRVILLTDVTQQISHTRKHPERRTA